MALDSKQAISLAWQLATIPDSPKTDQAIQALAIRLGSMCQDFDEAKWLVDEAVLKWSTWKGINGLSEMLYDKLHPPIVPSNQAKAMPPREDIHCEACGDWGHLDDPITKLRVWCECDMGKWQATRHPGLVEALNKTQQMKSLVRRLRHIKPITQQDVDRATAEHKTAKEVPDADTT